MSSKLVPRLFINFYKFSIDLFPSFIIKIWWISINLIVVLVPSLWLWLFLKGLLWSAWLTRSLDLSRLSENYFVQHGFGLSHSMRSLSLVLILVVSPLSEDIYVQKLFMPPLSLISQAFCSLELSRLSIGVYVQKDWISLR